MTKKPTPKSTARDATLGYKTIIWRPGDPAGSHGNVVTSWDEVQALLMDEGILPDADEPDQSNAKR